MRLGTLMDLRVELGHGGEPGISESYASALKKAAGVTARKFDINFVIRWLRDNPNFKMSDVYKRKPKSAHPCSSQSRSVLVADTSHE